MKRIQNTFWILLAVAGVGYFIYKVAMRALTDHFVDANPQHIKAVIIDEKNYIPNQPVKGEFSYSYLFKINGKEYTGNSHDTALRIGDTVEVEYYKEHPNLNKPLHPKD